MDDIAGAVAACAYIDLAEICGEQRYMDAALRLLHALDERHIDLDPARDGLLTHCSAAHHNDSARHVNMVYGDYFFVEAVRKLCGDGSEEVFSLEKTAEPQRFAITERTATSLTLGRHIKADDDSPFPALPGAQRYLFLISCAQQINRISMKTHSHLQHG